MGILTGLHRADHMPQWNGVPASKRNLWQRTAFATKGVVTPGNFVTLIGFSLVVWGFAALLVGQLMDGIILIVVGRAADILDGIAAELTATKSPLGETLDASLDKVATILMIVVLYVAALVPWLILTLLLLPHLYITAVTLVARAKQARLHPSRAGKLSMATAWICLVGFIVLHMQSLFLLTVIVYVIGALSVVLGSVAAAGYAKALRPSR